MHQCLHLISCFSFNNKLICFIKIIGNATTISSQDFSDLNTSLFCIELNIESPPHYSQSKIFFFLIILRVRLVTLFLRL